MTLSKIPGFVYPACLQWQLSQPNITGGPQVKSCTNVSMTPIPPPLPPKTKSNKFRWRKLEGQTIGPLSAICGR